MFRLLVAAAFAVALVAPLARADTPAATPAVREVPDDTLARYARVEIAPTKTSIYIGTVSMTMPAFVRHAAGTYESTYAAKVFPYFFYNEKGTLAIDVSDDALRQLAAGQPIEFHGRGHNSDGDERRVEGRAVPTDATTGQIKVRVFVTKKIQLIFNTTYRFTAR